MKQLEVSEDELRALLVDRLAILSSSDFNTALEMARRVRLPLISVLIDRGSVPQNFLFENLARAWGVAFKDLKVSDIRQNALHAVKEEFARAHVLIPFDLMDHKLHVAMCDPRDRRLIETIQKTTGFQVTPYLATPPAILRACLLYKGDLREMMRRFGEGGAAVPSAPRSVAELPTAPELVTRILEYSMLMQASDIHIEPYELECLIRLRIDGLLHEALSLPPEAMPPLISRIKVLAGMRIDERRTPQDGRFEPEVSGIKVDLRVSSMPTHWGEKIVIRILSKEAINLNLEDLGLMSADYERTLHILLRPFGMILVTGPTGSGKSTTLYAMLSRVGAERRNIVNISTVEDPVEYTLPRVNQVSINPSAGMAFSSALRALLRQNPDIIMVGEIRDLETAEIAVRAALVGRLLLSTLHTNDATGAVPRLVDMGVE